MAPIDAILQGPLEPKYRRQVTRDGDITEDAGHFILNDASVDYGSVSEPYSHDRTVRNLYETAKYKDTLKNDDGTPYSQDEVTNLMAQVVVTQVRLRETTEELTGLESTLRTTSEAVEESPDAEMRDSDDEKENLDPDTSEVISKAKQIFHAPKPLSREQLEGSLRFAEAHIAELASALDRTKLDVTQITKERDEANTRAVRMTVGAKLFAEECGRGDCWNGIEGIDELVNDTLRETHVQMQKENQALQAREYELEKEAFEMRKQIDTLQKAQKEALRMNRALAEEVKQLEKVAHKMREQIDRLAMEKTQARKRPYDEID